MKGRPVDQLVYEYIFPKPRPQDPTTFQAFLQRHLVLEVRQEVHSFYGHLDTPEAKYPGLDYCHRTHRLRLSRWPWHRRLFRAFDALGLTPSEIATLTKWEGTRWAKERYEKEQGIVIRDTTADGFPNWVEPVERPAGPRRTVRDSSQQTTVAPAEQETDDVMDSDGDEELESVGVALNERLRERVAARNAGDTSLPLDEEWEQWLKTLMEADNVSLNAEHVAGLSRSSGLVTPEDLFLPRMVNVARAGRWDEIPGFLHQLIRERLEDGSGRHQPQAASILHDPSVDPRGTTIFGLSPTDDPPNPPRLSSATRSWRRTYSDLRLPATTAGRTNTTTSGVRLPPTAQAPGA